MSQREERGDAGCSKTTRTVCVSSRGSARFPRKTASGCLPGALWTTTRTSWRRLPSPLCPTGSIGWQHRTPTTSTEGTGTWAPYSKAVSTAPRRNGSPPSRRDPLHPSQSAGRGGLASTRLPLEQLRRIRRKAAYLRHIAGAGAGWGRRILRGILRPVPRPRLPGKPEGAGALFKRSRSGAGSRLPPRSRFRRPARFARQERAGSRPQEAAGAGTFRTTDRTAHGCRTQHRCPSLTVAARSQRVAGGRG